jgi:hypothetical protein
MKSAIVKARRALAVCALSLVTASSLLAQSGPKESQPKGPQIPDGERKAVEKIQAATDIAAKMKAAGEFVKKFPKSTLRAQVVSNLGAEIMKIQDPAQQTTLLENLAVLFDQPAEFENIYATLIEAHVKAQRYDQAFAASAKLLEKNPGDVTAMTQMALIGVEQLKRNNNKYLTQSQQYAVKTIALIEEDKKPATMEAQQWDEYKTRWLPHLYQALGIMAYLTQDKAGAREHLEKAASLNSTDPVTYMLLGSMIDEEYQALAKQYQSITGGPAKEDTYKKAMAKMDEVIEQFAHSVALAEGQEQFKQLHDQILQSLELYYKSRKGSTAGMRELIDKYKKQ